jgi:hypothetical protein
MIFERQNDTGNFVLFAGCVILAHADFLGAIRVKPCKSLTISGNGTYLGLGIRIALIGAIRPNFRSARLPSYELINTGIRRYLAELQLFGEDIL